MWDYILFDLDGTLTDPALGITNSIMYALKKYGLPVPERETLYKFIGPPLLDAFSKEYGISADDSRRMLAYYREYFSVTGIFENTLYDGITELLHKLKKLGKTVVMATSKPEEFASKIADHFGFAQYFDHIIGNTLAEDRPTKTSVIAYALAVLGNPDKSRVIMVGDRENDADGAHANGIKCAGVLYGYGSYEELHDCGTDYICKNIAELENLLIKE